MNFNSSSSPTRRASSSIQPPHLAQEALDDCTTRIKQVSGQVKLGISNENVNLKAIECPITRDVPKDLVVTNCGHIYDKTAIQQAMQIKPSCPNCRTPITTLSPIHVLRDLVETWQKEEPILTCSNFKRLDQKLSNTYLVIAKSLVDEQKYEEALEIYKLALQYINSPAAYAAVPLVYERLKEPEKATLSRLYLSLYQLQSGHIQEAITTLESCGSELLKLKPVIVGLKLQLCQSGEKISMVFRFASFQTHSEDKVFIYKQIIAHVPDSFEAYKLLIPLIQDPIEKRKLQSELCLLLTENPSRHTVKQWLNLQKLICSEPARSLIPTAISPQEWAAAATMKLPPYPQALKDFLAGNCTIWPGKKRSETHIVVPLFPQVIINGTSVPLTLDSLNQLDKRSGGPGYRYIWDQIPQNIPAEPEFHWGVLTNNVLPDSRDKRYADQLHLLPPGYEIPGVLDAARAMLWENRRSGGRCFHNTPYNYTRCKEKIDHYCVVIGEGVLAGLIMTRNYYDVGSLGTAGWRKFCRA